MIRRTQSGKTFRRKMSQLQGLETLEIRRLLDGDGIEILASDVDGDGSVGFLDYVEIVKHFGDKVARGHGDIDGDGEVSLEDFDSLAEHFGKERPSEIIEETIDSLLRPRGVPQAQLEAARFVQSKVDFVKSLGRGKNDDAPAFLDIAANPNAVFYPVLQAGRATGAPPDSPTIRIDANVATSDFGGVGSIEAVHPVLGTFLCTGTVISPTHVLTAGHCFDVENDGIPDTGITGTFNLNDGSDFSSTHIVSQIDIHPDFSGFSNGGNDDLSILTLATPVPAATPIYSVRLGTMAENEVLEMVGYGQAGDGDTGFTIIPSFSEKRIGANEADLFVVDDEGTGTDEIYFFDFDEPTGVDSGTFGGTTLGNDIETTVGGGDSGGPAFVEVDGERVLAGVNTFNWELLGSTAPVGFFGSLGGGVILDSYVDWIFSISPDAIDSNDAPTFTAGGNVSVLEDAGAQSLTWATDITANDSGQTLEFLIVSNSNESLFDVAPTLASNGTLTFTSQPNVSGTADITVVLKDDGGTDYNGQDTSVSHTFTVEILSVNDEPNFSVGSDIVVLQDVGAQVVPGFANGFDPGPLESSQTVAEYVVTNDNPAMFSVQPSVSTNGDLTFTPDEDVDGLANISIQVRDSGGTANGGDDLSTVLPFTITTEPVDPPPPPVEPPDLVFTLSGDVDINEDANGQIPQFATEIGEDVETFLVVNDNESIFRMQPRINAVGRLQFVPKPDAFGSATVEVVANGENQQSEVQVFELNILPINDAPLIEIGDDVNVPANSGAHTFTSFATGFDPGNSYENQSIKEFVVKNDSESLFAEQPKVNTNGVLTFRVAPNTKGVANVAVAVRDNGGTSNGGQDLSEYHEFSINVVPDSQIPPTGVIRNGQLVVKGSGQQLLGLDFHSESGLLTNRQAAAPFDFYLAEEPHHVSLGVLGRDSAVDLNGEIVTSVFYSGTEPDGDLTATWGDLYGNTFELDLSLEGPAVSGVVRNGDIVIQGSGQEMLGVAFRSNDGLLTNGPKARPFGFFLSETPNNVSLGVLGRDSALVIEEEVATPVSYSGTNPEEDLTAAWGDLYGNSIDLEVTIEAPKITAVARDGRITLTGNGQQMLGLDFRSRSGLLSSDTSPSPFGFYLANTSEAVSLGVLGESQAVTLNGTLTTSILYSGSDPENDLLARWADVEGNLYEFEVEFETSALSGFIDEDNYIVLQGTNQNVVGLDLQSPDGALVPVEDGNASPFTVLLANTEKQITAGMLGDSVEVNGVVRTNIRYKGDLDRLAAYWGDESGKQLELMLTRKGDPCLTDPSLETIDDCADNLDERDDILARLSFELGDIDKDGTVGFGDFLKLADSFGKSNKRYLDGDLDLNGKVTFGDFLILADNFGKSA